MASAQEVASVEDVVSVPNVASVPNGTPAHTETLVTNGTSVSNDTSLTNGTSHLNGGSLPNGISTPNGTSPTNGTSTPNGTAVLNGTSTTTPVTNGISAVASVPDDPVTFPVPEGSSADSSTPARLRLAIIGGGIGGISLALGLLKHTHVDVQIYEAAPVWVQIGAGLGLGPNAQAALELLGPETEAAFRKNVTGNLWESHQKTFLNFFAVSLYPYLAAWKSSDRRTEDSNCSLRHLGPWTKRRPIDPHPKVLHRIAIVSPCALRQ